MPKIHATRSNLATATRPQLTPPTRTRPAARTSSFFICTPPVEIVSGSIGPDPAFVKVSSRSCIVSRVSEPGRLRIGELSRRSGVSPELLRAWERRYRLLRPMRSAGGLRLYSADDLERVRTMQHHLGQGLAAAEAAALASEQAAS